MCYNNIILPERREEPLILLETEQTEEVVEKPNVGEFTIEDLLDGLFTDKAQAGD